MMDESITNQKIPGCGYIRYSSSMQDDSFSLQAQERQIRNRATQDGVEIIKIFADPAESAYRKRIRPGIKEMLESAKRGEFKVLYVHKVDRLARRLSWSLEIVDELTKKEIYLRAVEQNFDLSTPDGKLIFHFLSSLGEFYSDNLSRETMKGKLERSHEGYHNGITPWAYTSELVNGRKKAIPVPELTEFVKTAYERYASGVYSDLEIAEWLNQQGCHTKRGRIFTKDTIREILQNPFYAGKVRYRGSRERFQGRSYRSVETQERNGLHAAIIDQDLFDKCQSVRASRNKNVKGRQITKRVYYLNGIIICSHCGRHLRAQTYLSSLRYYRECSRQRGFEDCPVQGQAVKAEIVEQQISELINSLVLPQDWRVQLEKSLESEQKLTAKTNPDQERTRLKGELRRLRQSFEHGLFEGEEHLFWRKIDALKSELGVLEQSPVTEIDMAAKTILEIHDAWNSATEEERRELVQMMLETVCCDVNQGKILWIKPRSEYVRLFSLIGLTLVEPGVFSIPPRES